MNPTCVYLKWDKWAAVFDFIARRSSMEVPLSFEWPPFKELPPTTGLTTNWPQRVVVGAMAR